MPDITPTKIPNHIAIIMDGNGRWAKSRGLPRIVGHKKGADIIRDTMEACQEAGVHYLTIYAFSAENWKRPITEISELMELLRVFLDREINNLHKKGVKLRVIGDTTKLEEDICKQIDAAEKLTGANQTFNLTVALSYGARQEMTRAVRLIANKVSSGEIDADKIDEKLVCNNLYTSDLPDPDLLIRTGGEERLSNFLLWQSAYTELYFSDLLWPDFTAKHLHEAIAEYANRERRYGTTNE